MIMLEEFIIVWQQIDIILMVQWVGWLQQGLSPDQSLLFSMCLMYPAWQAMIKWALYRERSKIPCHQGGGVGLFGFSDKGDPGNTFLETNFPTIVTGGLGGSWKKVPN